SRTLDNVAKQLRELRTEAARSFDLSKVLTQVREQLVDRDQVPMEVREKAAAALKEAQLLRANGQEASARRHLVQALEEMEQAVRAEKLSTGGETATRIRQVRDEIAREPNVSKAVEYARRQVVEAPDVDRSVAERVDRALREVVQLQRQGRESEARARLNQALMQVEQEVRAPEEGNRVSEKASRTLDNVAKQLRELRTEAARSFDLSKVLTQVREQLVDRDQVPVEVREKAAAALKEAQLLRANGQEASARRHLVQALDEMEQAVRAEKLSTGGETATRIRQVRDEIAREPNVSKAVEYARRQVVEAPDVDRNVAEQVDRALREVVQLQRQGRESEARVRLNQALMQMEQEVRISETGQQPKHQMSYDPRDLAKQIGDIRTEAARSFDLSKVLTQVREQLVDRDQVPMEVREKAAAALKEAQLLRANGQEASARRHLVQALDEMEQAVRTEKLSTNSETAARIQQVRDQIAREPNVSKAVEYARRQVVEAPDVDRNVAERVDRTLREVVQLQRQGRESEARARLNQALEETVQAVHTEKSSSSGETISRIHQVRDKIAREPNVSKAVEYARRQVVEAPDVDRNVAEQVDRALREVVQLQRQGRESEARVRLNQALEETVQAVHTEKSSSSGETISRIHQVRDQIAREPNVSKAVEYARRQVVEAPDVDRNVAERVDRALREVVQLQRQGREGEARVRLNQALMQVEQEVRIPETGQQPKHQMSYDPRDLAKQIGDIRTEAARTRDLSVVLPRIRSRLVEDGRVPEVVRQKVEVVLKETIWLQQINQHRLAQTYLVRQLAQLEQMAAVGHTVGPTSPVSTGQAANVQETADGAVGKEAARTSAASPLEPMESVIEHEPPRHAPLANVQETDAAQRTGQIYEAIRQAIKLFQHEPILDKALDVVQGKMREALHSQPHWRQSWNDAFAKAMELKEKGRELAARQTVLKTLNEIESSLSSTLNDRPANVDALFDGAWQAGLSLETKDFLVQTVTKKMAQAARDFQTVKRDVMRHLETALQWTEQGGQAARLQARQLLETAIKQLDNTILKSDIMLFTDMVTEKRLMKASSQLAEAKKRLQQGDEHGARTIVKEVKDVLANIVLKPSEAKVKHFVAGLGEPQGDLSETFFRQMNEAAQPFVDGPSARQLFEALRRFGFMHDYEAAESLVQKDANGEGTPQNMKAMLLQLAQSGNEPIARQAEQALTNLTGQQLLNRWDAGAGMQSLFFSLPLLWQNEVRNVNVYVNARQDGERIDWENCRLYFLLETKKLGDLGILLQANERHLSITLRNDREDFAEKASPFIDAAKKRLEEIGYRVISVNVTKLTNETKRQEEEKRAPSARLSAPFTERGYDFTI
ncbi:hypothetical protein, partial [Geobacillus sp. BK01]|uniref:hypothetical protein n=1 Tax=Geobacillus sp. BK01 TaxID=3457328 RepID=UPI003FA5C492